MVNSFYTQLIRFNRTDFYLKKKRILPLHISLSLVYLLPQNSHTHTITRPLFLSVPPLTHPSISCLSLTHPLLIHLQWLRLSFALEPCRATNSSPNFAPLLTSPPPIVRSTHWLCLSLSQHFFSSSFNT